MQPRCWGAGREREAGLGQSLSNDTISGEDCHRWLVTGSKREGYMPIEARGARRCEEAEHADKNIAVPYKLSTCTLVDLSDNRSTGSVWIWAVKV